MIKSVEASPATLEPLPELARFSLDWAHALCRPEHGCLTYHRAWSALRLFDQGGASPQGWNFLQRELRRIPDDAPRRVLISGSADTGLMAVVASAFAERAAVRVALAERCETTLQQNLLFARHLGREVELHRGDVRQLACDPVDAVIGHSFLNYFEDEQLPELAVAWMRVLKPGGVILLSNRLAQAPSPVDTPAVTPEPPATSAGRLGALREHATAYDWHGRELERLETAAIDFWRIPPRRIVTEQTARQALTRAGFEQIRIDYPGTREGDQGSRPRGKSSHPRAEIVARKPLS